MHPRILVDLERIGKALWGFGGAIGSTLGNIQRIAAVAEPVAILWLGIIVGAIALFFIALAFRDIIGEFIYVVADESQDVVNDIISVVIRVMKFFHLHPRPSKQYYAQHIAFMKNKHQCDPFDSYSATILFVVRQSTSRHICPTVRYLYGTPVGALVWTFVSLFSFNPDPEGANCSPGEYAEYCVYFIEQWRFWMVAAASMIVLFVSGVAMPILYQTLLVSLRTLVLSIDLVYYAVRVLMFLFWPHLRHDKLPHWTPPPSAAAAKKA